MSKANIDAFIQDGLDRLRAEMNIIDARIKEQSAIVWKLRKIVAKIEDSIETLGKVKRDIQARADHAIKTNAKHTHPQTNED